MGHHAHLLAERTLTVCSSGTRKEVPGMALPGRAKHPTASSGQVSPGSEDANPKANKKIKCMKKRTETNTNSIPFSQKNIKHLRCKRLSEGPKRWLDSFISDLLLRRGSERLFNSE